MYVRAVNAETARKLTSIADAVIEHKKGAYNRKINSMETKNLMQNFFYKNYVVSVHIYIA